MNEIEEQDRDEKVQEKNNGKDSGLQCLLMIAAYYGIPVDGDALLHEMALEDTTLTVQDIQRLAKRTGLKSKSAKVNRYALAKMTLPGILVCEGEKFWILAQASEEQVLVLDPSEKVPEAWSYEKLEEIWEGELILFIPRDRQKRDVKFGFKWFIPTILRFKRPLLEVLLAAFVIQILSICSPLVTQSVIDKVLVHNSLSRRI